MSAASPSPGRRTQPSPTQGGVLVTGASTGIGRCCALELDRLGFTVFGGVRDQAAAERLRSDGSARLETVRLDITDAKQIESAVARLEDQHRDRRFAGVVANAGITVNGPLEFLPPDEVRRQLEVNVVGQLAVLQPLIALLRRDRGRIVLVGSVSGFSTLPFLGPYSMSKHALEAMADALRLELASWGVRVSLLQPGAIRTPIFDKGRRQAAEVVAQATERHRELYAAHQDALLRLVAEHEKAAAPPEVVARAVVHALTARRPRARYLMGGNARVQKLLSRLPDRWRDAVLLGLLRRLS